MSFQKKNVIQGFIRDDYVPTSGQYLVKYFSGKGNNLHEVQCFDGSTILVSMPKKFRQTVWLKRGDCLVIDPIEEGKKVKGEIVCLVPNSEALHDLIKSRKQWPASWTKSNNNAGPDEVEADVFLKFLERSGSEMQTQESSGADVFDPFLPSSSSSSSAESDSGGENGLDVDEDLEVDNKGVSVTSDNNIPVNFSMESCDGSEVDEATRERNRSRVQLVTSGIVTVTNVVSDGLENDIQSLEFEADEEDESCDEEGLEKRIHRHTNTIRIQVNYNNAN